MMSLSGDKQADIIKAFNTTSRYLSDILNINNVYFENLVSQKYPPELQLNKDKDSDDSFGVYISQLNRFARAFSHVADFNTGNKLLTQKLLKQGDRYHKLRNTSSKFLKVIL